MPYDVTHERRPGYLYARMEGEESYEEAVRFWHALSDIAVAEGFTRFLVVDTVAGRLSTTQHYQISVIVADLFMGKHIAYVDPKQETFDNNSFGETVVVNRGVFARVFRTESEAEEWLLAQLASREERTQE